jgi:hypothetical protein
VSITHADEVVNRVDGSVNVDLADLTLRYPLGNGLGAGGTSVPYYLQALIRDPIWMENEYCRILLEEGWVGFGIWAAFIAWIIRRRPTEARDPWYPGRRLMWYKALASFALGLLGIGLLTAIPQAALLMLGIGFLATPSAATVSHPAPKRVTAGAFARGAVA